MTHTVNSVDEMIALGSRYAKSAKAGDIFALKGEMGAGKTHWTKGFLQFYAPQITVNSPTFSLINEYRSEKLPVYHLDLHRLEKPEELLAMDWDDYVDEEAIIIVEWADKFSELIPENASWLEFTHLSENRRQVAELD